MERSVPESAEQLDALELSRFEWFVEEDVIEEADVSAYVSEDRPESTEM